MLVEPTLAANIGAAARAIKTMGFDRLTIVNPRNADYRDDPDAVALATGAADVLAASRSVGSLDEALQGVAYAAAMTGYDREFGPPLVDLREVAGECALQLARAAQDDVAFVFGTERSGLANDDVRTLPGVLCDSGQSGLRVAQSGAVGAGGCVRSAACIAWRPPRSSPGSVASRTTIRRPVSKRSRSCTPTSSRRRLAVGFHDPAEPKTLMVRVRRLINRARPTQTEIDLLRGVLAAMIESRAERAGRKRSR